MFKNIQNIISLINRKKIGDINIFDPNTSLETVKKDVFFGIIDKKVTNDQELSLILGFKNKSDKGYLMAMGRFRDQLINLLFFLDNKSYPNVYSAIKIKAIKHFLFGKIFLLTGVQSVSQIEFQRAIKHGLKSDFVEIVELAMLDYIKIGVRTGEGSYLRKYIKDYELIRKWSENLKQSEYQLSLIFSFINTKSKLSDKIKTSFKQSVKIVNEIENPFNDIRIREIKFLSNAYLLNSESKFTELLNECENYWDFIVKSDKARNKHKKECLRFSLIGHLRLKKFERSKEIFEQNKNIFNKNSHGFINFTELFFLTCMHTKMYEKAKNELNKTYKNSFFKAMPTIAKERWFIYESFLIFSIKISSLSSSDKKDDEIYELKTKRFLSQKPIYSRDKKGLNTQIIISQFLHLLSLKNYNEIIDRTTALKIYNNRYLRKQKNSDYVRTYNFIKILLKLVKYSFNKKKIVASTKKDLRIIKELSKTHRHSNKTLEIIPYEDLWTLILNTL